MLKSVVEPSKSLAAVLMALLMGVTGVAVFLWMAGTGWQDVHGVGVGVIFISLSLAQTIYGIFWYRAIKRESLQQERAEVNGEMSAAKEMSDLRRSPAKETGKAAGVRESAAPLLANRESAAVVEVDAVQVQEKMPTHVESQA